MQEAEAAADEADAERPSVRAALQQRPPVPKLAICIMVAGTRGDVQPFIALGLGLKVDVAIKPIALLCRCARWRDAAHPTNENCENSIVSWITGSTQ